MFQIVLRKRDITSAAAGAEGVVVLCRLKTPSPDSCTAATTHHHARRQPRPTQLCFLQPLLRGVLQCGTLRRPFQPLRWFEWFVSPLVPLHLLYRPSSYSPRAFLNQRHLPFAVPFLHPLIRRMNGHSSSTFGTPIASTAGFSLRIFATHPDEQPRVFGLWFWLWRVLIVR